MTEIGNTADDRIVVGYFADGGDAYRAINELIDEGFLPSEIGAAFRTPRAGAETSEMQRPKNIVGDNPAISGSVGGAGSHDQAVQPAGLAPGSGNAFPAPSRPQEITGSEIPSTLQHELKHDLPSETELHRAPAATTNAAPVETVVDEHGARRERMQQVFSDDRAMRRSTANSSQKFGTGEGHLFPSVDYSEPSFENSFQGMGLGSRESRSLSAELRRGGAVVSVAPGSRASLAEGILERNHGRIRFETAATAASEADAEAGQVEIYGRMHNYYRPDERFRKAS